MNTEMHMNQADLFNTEMRGQLTTVNAVKDFALAGNATITIRSNATDTRFTYKIRAPKNQQPNRPPIWFVSVLTGQNNEGDFEYLGNIRANGSFDHGRKARIKADAPSARAFNWFWNMVQRQRDDLLTQANVWHEGRCGRCGRKLTVPESVESGFGPECINHV
jgi:hypothetical protein